jgi:hypothetical protein
MIRLICDESMSGLSDMRNYVQNIFIALKQILRIIWVDMKVSPVLHFTSALRMKTFLAVVFLAALGFVLSIVSCSYIQNS